MNLSVLSLSAAHTKKTGEFLAKEVLKTSLLSQAFVLGLKGDLGGGKTTFMQGFAKGLGIKEKITSPTFVLLKRFEIPNSIFQNFYHIDCYRIKGKKDLFPLGFKEIISNPRNIAAIEWVDRLKNFPFKRMLTIEFVFISEKERRINFKINEKG